MANRSPQTLLRRLGDLLVWALVLVAPLVLVITADDAFRLPKLLAAEWLGLASLVAYALAAAVGAPDEGVARSPWWRNRAVLAVAPVVAVASLGLVTGDHPGHTRTALADLWIGGACLAGWALALPAARAERYLRATAVPGSLMALLAVLQFHGVFRPFRFTGGEEAFRTGVTSLAGNAGDLGAFLVLPALVAQWGLVRSLGTGDGRRRTRRGARSLRRAAPWAAALVLCVYGIVASQTLTALAALVAGAAVLWLAALPVRRAAAAAAAVAVVAGAVLAASPPLRERAAAVRRLVAEGDWNAALTGRLDGWRTAVWMVREHPWAGVGHGAYRAEFATAKLELQERGVEFYRQHADPFFANAHNDFLEALAEWGLPGAAALAWALLVLARALLAGGAGPPGGTARRRRAFAWAGTTAAAILALGHFPFHVALVAYPYLLFFAWVFRRGEEAEAEAGA